VADVATLTLRADISELQRKLRSIPDDASGSAKQMAVAVEKAFKQATAASIAAAKASGAAQASAARETERAVAKLAEYAAAGDPVEQLTLKFQRQAAEIERLGKLTGNTAQAQKALAAASADYGASLSALTTPAKQTLDVVEEGATKAAGSGTPRVQFVTSEGRFTVELDAARAPKTVGNFLEYVRAGFYNGTVFHRVIDGFMIQGGGFDDKLAQKPTRAPIPLEAKSGLKNERGTIAMARTNVPDSATAQFFINVVDNPNLDYPKPDGNGYAVFGRVVEGMDVVDRIKALPTTSVGPHGDVPTKPVVIRTATLVK
jgi:peptidyl-prolyl cis-trans isomerase A (cyclophilin A)